jgi:hypothetical protein
VSGSDRKRSVRFGKDVSIKQTLTCIPSWDVLLGEMAKAPDADGYMALIRTLQAECSDLTRQRASTLGEKAPVLLQALDVLLSYLERAATCFGGCRGGDHRAELLTGRAVSSCQAALLLMSNGYYDEALATIRGLGEVANLMSMFTTDAFEFERWMSMDEKTRRRDFAPVKVRLWLEQKAGVLVVDAELYAALSGYSIHASPNSLPQAHGEHGNASIGPLYQEAGFLLCLNELARSMAFIGIFSAKLIGVTDEIRSMAHDVSRVVIENMGAISADVHGRPWFKLS